MSAMSRARQVLLSFVPTSAYAMLACLLTWPLPLHLRTHLPGSPSGDLGVYVWNLWIFRHEIVRHGRLPFSTDHIFADAGGADFSLHNYTPIAGALAAPLIDTLGVVGAFNVVLLAFMTLSGLGVFVLARRIGLGSAAAWVAGAVFMASPVLTAKGTAHFSLVAAAALPLFLWALLRTIETTRTRDGALVGTLVAVATYSDAYYGIYCVLMGAFLVAWHLTHLDWRGAVRAPRTLAVIHTTLALLGAVVIWRLWSGTTALAVGPVSIGLQTLYTPVLVLVAMVLLRGWLATGPVIRLDRERLFSRLVHPGLVAVAVCAVWLLPLLVGLALRFIEDRLPGTETFWRSSPRGVDALAYVVPNPTHAWFGARTSQWFMPDRPDAFPEFVASFSLTALAVIGVAAWRRLLPGLWVAFTAFFVALSLGPFVHIAGINTYVIGPWALLRYVPVIAMARSPSRFAVVAVLGFSLLFAFAVQELYRRRTAGARQGWVAAGVVLAALLAAELTPVPRPLFTTTVPEVYRLIAANVPAEETGRLLELPTGVRDGTSSRGNFNVATQFFQTSHRRPLIGGYLSRVSRWRKQENERVPMLRALHTLSEGRELSPTLADDARDSRDAFLKRSCVEFVVVNKQVASVDLEAFAVRALGLTLVHEDDDFVLYTPIVRPPCQPRPQRKGLFAAR
jgi:hypothetical protein